MENLKIRFTLGSNIEEVYTDKTGYYAINNKLIDNQATVSFVFQHEKWTIVKGSEEGGRIEEIKGIYGELRSGKDLNFNINSSSAPDPATKFIVQSILSLWRTRFYNFYFC